MQSTSFRLLAPLLGLLMSGEARAGSITGRLLDPSGRPVAGARVQWTAHRTDDETLLDLTSGADPKVLGETATDAEGRFRVALEKPGSVALRLLPAGLPAIRLAGPFDSSEESALFDLQTSSAASLRGRVTDEAGKPVAGARVSAIGGEGIFENDARAYAEAKTDSEGVFSLPDAPEGARVLSVRAPGLVPYTHFQLEAKPEERVSLKRGGSVRGTVTDMSGKPAAGALVRAEELAVETDASGAYRIVGVPSGVLSVQAFWKEDFAARKESVRVRKEEETEASLRLARASSVAGTVIEEESRRPIAGVRVSAYADSGFRMASRRGNGTTRTDAQGRFRLRGLASRAYSVEASKEGFLTASISGVNAGVAAPGTAHLALARAASVSGRVVDEKSQPVPGARVRIEREMGTRQILRGARNPAAFLPSQGVLTGPDGAFRLRHLAAARNLSLEATKNGFARTRQPGITLKSGEAVKDLALVLRRGLEARGRVVDSQSRPVAGAEVRAAHRETGMAATRVQMRLMGMDREKPDAVTGADGSFLVKGLDEGEYALAISREGYTRKSVPSVEVKASGENVWPTITLSPGLGISGAIRDSRGQPIAGVQIFAIDVGGGGGLQNTLSEPDGRFRLDGLADRPLMINVSASGYSMLQRNVTPPAEDLLLVLKNAGSVRGRVEDADSKRPVIDFTVGRRGGGGGPFAFAFGGRGGDQSFQSEDGTFELTEVPAGKWTIHASAAGYRSGEVSGVEIGEGETKEGIVFSLKKGGVLSGRVLDPRRGTGIPNASVSWQPADSSGGFARVFARFGGSNAGSTTTDADGRFRFDSLPDGRVSVTASHPDFLEGSREVDPAKESSVDLTLGTGGSISGTVVGRDGRTGLAPAQVSLNEEGDTAFNFGGDSTRTDGAGNFLFEHLKPGRFKIVAQGSTGKTTSREVVLADGQRLDGVLLEIATGSLLRGTVSGLPPGRLGGVRVNSSGKDYNDSTLTDDAGAFTFKDVPAGAIHLQATTSFLSGRSTGKNIEVPDGAEEVSAEIVFEGISRLSGRVTRGEKPLGGLFVNANPLPPGPGSGRSTGQSDEDGRYALEGLNDGQYQVTLSGQGVTYRRTFTVSGDTNGDIALPPTQLAGTVTETGSGEPVEGVTVSIQAPQGTQSGFPMAKQGVSDSNGHYFIDDVDPATYQATARKTGYQAKTQPVTVGSDSAEFNFGLQRGEGITIRVLDGLTGLPLKGVAITAFSGGGAVAFQGSVSLDSTGKGEISSLGPGRYAAYFFSDGYAPGPVALDAPSSLVSIAMTPGGRLQLRTETPVLGRVVDAAGASYLLSPWRTDGKVSVAPPLSSWDHVAPGSYRLLVGLPGQESSFPFTVAEGQTVAIEVK